MNPDKSYYKTVVDSSASFLGDKVPLKKYCGKDRSKSENWIMVLPGGAVISYTGDPRKTQFQSARFRV